MIFYTEIKDEENNIVGIIKNDNGKIWSVPIDESNSDYQAYLNKDKAEQSTPMVTDEAATL
jgi:hypothetical protein